MNSRATRLFGKKTLSALMAALMALTMLPLVMAYGLGTTDTEEELNANSQADLISNVDSDANPLADPAPICAIGTITYTNLADAITAARNGDTITLLTNINHDRSVKYSGKSITIRTNGFTLQITAPTGHALDISGGSLLLDDSGGGQLNVASTTSWTNGVYVRNAGSSVTVTSVTSRGVGVYADAGTVTVKGDVTENNSVMGGAGIYARQGATVLVSGNVASNGNGVQADGNNTSVRVQGTVTGRTSGVFASNGARVTADSNIINTTGSGIEASNGSTVTVSGNVTASNTGGSIGAYCYAGTISISGNVSGDIAVYTDGATANTTINGNVIGTSFGVFALNGSRTTIDGEIQVQASAVYIRIGNTDMARSTSIGPTTKPGYTQYSDSYSYVWVRLSLAQQLAYAKEQKLAIINAVIIDLDENIYTPESWATLLAALSNARYEVQIATTLDAVEAVEVPDASEILELMPIDYACRIGSRGYESLTTALVAVLNGQTITLLSNIEYDQGISIYGKSITFDLNGYVLNVNNSSGDGLSVSNRAEVQLVDTRGGGALNVRSSYAAGYGGFGVSASGGSKVTVNSAVGVYAGVYASDVDTVVTVTGNVSGTARGVNAYEASVVNIGGNVSGADYGLFANNASISVTGTVTASDYHGVSASFTSNITISGSIVCGSIGILISNNTQVSVDGTITAGLSYMRVDGQDFIASDGTPSSVKQGYLEYLNNTSRVYVKGGAEVDLVQAKANKVAAIFSITNGLVISDYTADSWRALEAAISQALSSVNSATTVAQVDAVAIPNITSILIRKTPVSGPGSGDLFGTGVVTMQVALLVAQAVVGMDMGFTPTQIAAVDMDFDGALTMNDVLLIMRKVSGL
jgi:hypothetical protein